jgi:hypothetical protein
MNRISAEGAARLKERREWDGAAKGETELRLWAEGRNRGLERATNSGIWGRD